MRAVRHVLFLGSVLSLAACGGELESNLEDSEPGQTLAPLHLSVDRGQAIADEYIVVLKEGADARAVAAVVGVSPRYVYTGVNGFAGPMNAGQLRALRGNPAVEYVEQDQRVQASATQFNAPWNLDRIDQRSLPLNGTYNYSATASTVYTYIIDTGLRTDHADFGTRAKNVYDAFGGTGNDCNGHGTHVGGTAGGTTWGVAKGTQLRGVRVLDCNGSGSTSGILAGIDWVRLNHIKPAIANMSLGGGFSSTLNNAVNNLATAGVFVAVAAGGSNTDACNTSPASAANVTTAGCSTRSDLRCSSSNWGTCVHIYAPGESITSAWHTSTTATSTLSGTSMSSPQVAGVGALYKATYGDASYSTIRSWIVDNATPLSWGRLLFKGTL
jgi:subtilisin family serine protease